MEEYLLLGDISTEEWEVKQFLESVNDVQFNNIAYQAVPNVSITIHWNDVISIFDP
jgi:hypothetical protein